MSANLDDDPWVGTPSSARKQPIPRYVWWALGGCGALFVLCVAGLAFLLYRIGSRGDDHALEGDEVPPATVAWLLEKGLLERDEELVCFFSPSASGVESEGVFCTDRRVVDYRDGPEWTVRQVAYVDLAKVSRRSPNLLAQEVELRIAPRGGEPFGFVVPIDGPQYVPFEDALREAWRAAQPAAAYASEGLWHGQGELASKTRTELVAKAVLPEEEEVLAGFGWDGTPLGQWGTLCTPKRLVVYSFTDPAKPEVWTVLLTQLEAVELRGSDPDENEEDGLFVRVRDDKEYRLEGDIALLGLFEPVLSEARVAAQGR